jgi:hypothetical protein
VDRADVDDGTSASPDHDRDQRAARQVIGLEVDSHDPIPLVFGHVRDGVPDEDPGVVDEDVGATPGLHRGRHQP